MKGTGLSNNLRYCPKTSGEPVTGFESRKFGSKYSWRLRIYKKTVANDILGSERRSITKERKRIYQSATNRPSDMAGFCERGAKIPDFITDRRFLDWTRMKSFCITTLRHEVSVTYVFMRIYFRRQQTFSFLSLFPKL